MSSNKTIPYFYLIKHKQSGMLYAGSKTSKKDAFPDKFMVPGGYLTSSETVKRIIKEEGIDAFEIIEILTEADVGMSVSEYEKKILRENNVSKNPNWLNCHENVGINYADVAQMEKVRDLYEQRTGYRYPMQNPAVIQKSKEICLEKYGVENSALHPAVIAKREETCVLRYGITNRFRDQEFQSYVHQLSKAAIFAKYGSNSSLVSQEVKEKAVNTMIERYGVVNPAKNPELAAKSQAGRKKYFFEKYGKEITSAGQIPEIADKIRNTVKDKSSNCPHCGKFVNFNNSWHFDNCVEHPDPIIRERNLEKVKLRIDRLSETKKHMSEESRIRLRLAQGSPVVVNNVRYPNVSIAMDELNLTRFRIITLAKEQEGNLDDSKIIDFDVNILFERLKDNE